MQGNLIKEKKTNKKVAQKCITKNSKSECLSAKSQKGSQQLLIWHSCHAISLDKIWQSGNVIKKIFYFYTKTTTSVVLNRRSLCKQIKQQFCENKEFVKYLNEQRRVLCTNLTILGFLLRYKTNNEYHKARVGYKTQLNRFSILTRTLITYF